MLKNPPLADEGANDAKEREQIRNEGFRTDVAAA
jgi:hypothetical protein